MRILIFAYEFPPVLSAQSLRWYYLSRELAELGVEVDILTSALRDIWKFNPTLHPSITVFRCFPGPYVGFSGWMAKWFEKRTDSIRQEVSRASRVDSALERAYRFVRHALDNVLFPDVRTEWFPFAWYTARKLNRERAYSLTISSHEPGVDLMLGAMAQSRWRIPWVVDLADPVLAPYSPGWRNRLDRKFERFVCERADQILITAEGMKKLLTERHALAERKLWLVRQGYDHRSRPEGADGCYQWPDEGFILVFTGNFYREFRSPEQLIEALREHSGVTLVMAGSLENFGEEFEVLGERAVFLGRRPHGECLALQRSASVLLSVGNRQDYQVPGKLYEYLGAGRPILHIVAGGADSVPEILESCKRGVAVENHANAISAAVGSLFRRWEEGVLEAQFDLTEQAVADYSWASQATNLYRAIRQADDFESESGEGGGAVDEKSKYQSQGG